MRHLTNANHDLAQSHTSILASPRVRLPLAHTYHRFSSWCCSHLPEAARDPVCAYRRHL